MNLFVKDDGMSEYSIEQIENMVKIGCPRMLDIAAAAEFSRQCKSWMMKPAEHFVLDFSSVLEISRDFYRAIIHFKTSLRKDGKLIYAINLSPALLKQITRDGVEQAFNPVKSIDTLAGEDSQGEGKAASLDVEFLNPFLSAIRKTLEIQCNTKVKLLKPRLKRAPEPDVDIAGVLSLISNGFSGSIVLCFSKKVFLKVYENMFDEKHENISPEIEDAAGELLNIIYGSAKVELNQKGYDFKKALPTVLSGEKIVVRQAGVKPAVIIPVETDVGEFQVEIEFQNK